MTPHPIDTSENMLKQARPLTIRLESNQNESQFKNRALIKLALLNAHENLFFYSS